MTAGRGKNRERLPQSARLAKGAQIRELFRRGRRRTGRLMVVYSRLGRSQEPGVRAGWVVARFGHPAVERNRLKRRIREVLRRRVLPQPELRANRVRLLVQLRRNAYRATYAELERELLRLVRA